MMGKSVLNVKKKDCLMMLCWMMLAGTIHMIVDAMMPEIEELTLCIVALEPMEALIH